MKYLFETKENERIAAARESFSGRLLTNSQFDEAIAITGIIEQEIQRSGAFKDKLGDYAYAFARSEKFDATKSETIIRDLFKERTGRTMNQMREALINREEATTDAHRAQAYSQACAIGDLMENGIKLSFNRAYAHQAHALASELGVTDAFAKRLMRDEFAAAEESELQDWGKELDATLYRPQIDAEKEKREAVQEQPVARRVNRTVAPRSRPGPQ